MGATTAIISSTVSFPQPVRARTSPAIPTAAERVRNHFLMLSAPFSARYFIISPLSCQMARWLQKVLCQLSFESAPRTAYTETILPPGEASQLGAWKERERTVWSCRLCALPEEDEAAGLEEELRARRLGFVEDARALRQYIQATAAAKRNVPAGWAAPSRRSPTACVFCACRRTSWPSSPAGALTERHGRALLRLESGGPAAAGPGPVPPGRDVRGGGRELRGPPGPPRGIRRAVPP